MGPYDQNSNGQPMSNYPQQGNLQSGYNPNGFYPNTQPQNQPMMRNNYQQRQDNPYPMHMNNMMPQPMPTYSIPTPPPGLYGRVINQESDIQIQEIPLNGNYVYFPTSDQNKIIVRHWNGNGEVVSDVFVRSETNSQLNKGENIDVLNDLYVRLGNIENSLASMSDRYQNRKVNRNNVQYAKPGFDTSKQQSTGNE